jgi:uncharacterized membrane protein
MTSEPPSRGRFGLAMSLLAAAALAIASYLTWQHLGGEVPPCGPLEGCDTVLRSEFAVVAGIPVALPGVAAALAMLVAALAWWRWADRRALLVAYLVGMASVAVLAYLTFLEVAVIGAVCAWCVTFAGCTVAAWLLAVAALRSGPAVADR